MERGPAVILLLGCFGLATAKHVNTAFLSGKRDVISMIAQNPYRNQFDPPPPNIDAGLQPPQYMTSLLNQILDMRGGGHNYYLNIYPSSWTTNQVNSELTVDVQFTALLNNQNVRCSAHIIASMPPSNNNPTIVTNGSTVQCSPSGGGTMSYAQPVNPGLGYNRYGAPAIPTAAYGAPPSQYNTIPNYYQPRGPQLVYRTKYVPITVQALVPPPPEPIPGNYLPAVPGNNPPYPPIGPVGIPQYNGGILINDNGPIMPNYMYR